MLPRFARRARPPVHVRPPSGWAPAVEPAAPADIAAKIAVSTLAGTGAPPALRAGFTARILSWGHANGDEAMPRRLRALDSPQASAERARLLAPLVARHLGRGHSGLTRVLEQRLADRGESELRRLLERPDGKPSQPQINELRGAMVRLISTDAPLQLAEQRRLDSALIESLRALPPEGQRRWLIDLANSPTTRNALVQTATQRSAEHSLTPAKVEAFNDGLAPSWNAIIGRTRIDPIRRTEARLLLNALRLRAGDRVAHIGIGSGD